MIIARWFLVVCLLASPMRSVADSFDDLARAFIELELVLRKLDLAFDKNEKQWRELNSSLESLNRRLQHEFR